jgi:hypothetical protein
MLKRIIFCYLISFFLGGFFNFAGATGVVNGTVTPFGSCNSHSGAVGSTSLSDCPSYAKANDNLPASYWFYVGASLGGANTSIDATDGTYILSQRAYFTQTSTTTVCPSGSTLTGSSCVCDGASVPNASATACVAPPCASNLNISSGWYDTPNSGTGAPPTTACAGSCSVNYSGSSISKTAIVNGIPHYYSQGSYDTNGFSCTSGEPSVGSATAAVPPDTCPDGQIFVRNSFGFICAVDFTAAAAASSVPATSLHPAGSSAPTQASVNTTSTTTNTSTGSTTTTTGTMTIPPITLNLPPDLAKTGDITSQTATLVSKMDELKFPYTDVTSKLGSAPTSELVPHTTPTFTATPVIFASAAGCPAPVAFTVYGHDYFISYQPFCDFSSNIRTLFLALAAVTAAMIFAAGMTI